MNYELLQLVHYWYFPSNKTSIKPFDFKNISSIEMIDLWINKWFAKYEQQKEIDIYLKTFESLIDHYKTYIPNSLFEKMSMIILYDQIPRNIYRKTPNAYLNDHIALKLAKSLLYEFDSLPLCFQITIVVCMLHSEDINDHNIIIELLPKIKINPKCDPKLYISLYNIFKNHNERIIMFGRIPERNKFLSRISTEQEKAFLQSV
jgi:uncharacterized protein (DUF924 family)